jgi:hypothetical protein
VFANEPIEDCAPFRQAFERADLISAHEAAVALTSAAKTATSFRLTFVGSDMRAPLAPYGEPVCGRVPVASTNERQPSGTPANRMPSQTRSRLSR